MHVIRSLSFISFIRFSHVSTVFHMSQKFHVISANVTGLEADISSAEDGMRVAGVGGNGLV